MFYEVLTVFELGNSTQYTAYDLLALLWSTVQYMKRSGAGRGVGDTDHEKGHSYPLLALISSTVAGGFPEPPVYAEKWGEISYCWTVGSRRRWAATMVAVPMIGKVSRFSFSSKKDMVSPPPGFNLFNSPVSNPKGQVSFPPL